MARLRKRGKKEAPAATPATTGLLEGETEEEASADVLEFIRAIDDYRRTNGRPFPTWTEVLGILRSLGYRKSG